MRYHSKYEAKEAYKKFCRSNRRFLFLTDKSEVLKNFEDIQKENKAYTSVSLGLKEVPIGKIVGSVQKYMDFDKNFVPLNKIIEQRWCNIYLAFLNDKPLPIVQLYKIKEDYFVYDGNHRISVANYLRFSTIEAEVTEFMPSSNEKDEALYREKFVFEKEYNLDNFDFTEVYFFSRIKKELNDYGTYLEKVEKVEDLTKDKKTKLWLNRLYKNAYNILSINNMTEYFRDRTLSDIYIYYLDHKYYESEKRGYNLGYFESIISFVNTIKTHENKSLENTIVLDEESIQLLRKLDQLDFRQNNKDIMKYDILLDHFGSKYYRNTNLLFLIKKYGETNEIESFEKASKRWAEEELNSTIETFFKRASVLDEKYKNLLEVLLEDKIKLYFSIEAYEHIYKIKYKEENYGGIVNYILDIFIPIGSKLDDKILVNNIDEYFDVFEKYNYLIEYNPNIPMEKAIEAVKEEKKKSFYNYYKYSNFISDDSLLESLGNNQLIKDNDGFKLLKKIILNFGYMDDYSKIIKLYEYINYHFEKGYDLINGEKKIINEIEELIAYDEINIYYKNKSSLEFIKKKKQISFLDIYMDILDRINHLGSRMVEVNKMDITKEFLVNHLQ